MGSLDETMLRIDLSGISGRYRNDKTGTSAYPRGIISSRMMQQGRMMVCSNKLYP